MVFQDQYGCLNPRMTAGQAIAEPIERFQRAKHATDIQQRVCELLEAVQLPWEAALKFPNELSGGQARRIGVARAIALNPEFILADEPTSGLDISTAATILNLMQDLQEQMDITYLWISHNLNQVRYMAEDMAVMYLGKIVETGRTEDVFQHRAHPYTKALISAVPKVCGSHGPAKIILEGEIPSPINPPSGCRFRTRCSYMKDKCRKEEPALMEIGSGHFAACHLLSSDR
jgi:oligopeptide/dipeptide ABC transporter ATP-binding protein